MKKNLLILFTCLVLVIFPNIVKAENKIYFEDEAINVSPGETKKVNIVVESEADFNEVNMSMITTSSQITFYSVDFSEDFTRDVSGSIYKLTSKKPVKSGTVIGSVTIKAKEEAKLGTSGYIRIANATLTLDKEVPLSNTQVKVTVSNEKSNNNYLSNITSNIVNLNFNKETLKYEVEVENEVEELDLVPVKEDSSSTVEISSQKLKEGKNVIKITVISETEEKRIYEITVNRKKVKEEAVSKNTVDKENKKAESSNEGKLSWIFILFLLIGALAIDVVYMKMKKQK